MKTRLIRSLTALAVGAACSAALQAEEVIIEARVALLNGDPAYAEFDGNWQNSSVHTTAPGVTAGVGSRFNTTAGSSVVLMPTLEAGGTYLVFAAFPAPSSQTADMVAQVDIVGGTLTELSEGTTAVGNAWETTVFQRAGGSTSWRPIGTLDLDEGVTQPTITFTHLTGDISNATTSRFYSDSYRFVNAGEPCLSGLDVLVTVNGPLAAGQTFVDVPGVDPTATAITIYSDGVQIGQKTTDIVGGETVERVETEPLVAGQTISVTQSNGDGVESCRPNTGPIVGGGANPAVRVAFSLRLDPALEGPIGETGTSTSTWLWMLGATGPSAGFGTAPLGGTTLYPSTCWQEVTFHFDFDSGYTWAGTSGEIGLFALLDSIAFSIEPPFDTGPYAIYIDNIRNGSTVIEDFEGVETNATYLFPLPNFSGSTSGNLLSPAPGTPTPNISTVSNENADTGTNSVFVSWQFKDAAEATWLRLPLQGAGRANPMVDLGQSISVRFLVLPVGETEGALQVETLGNRTEAIGSNITLEAPAIKGDGPFSYEWSFNGEIIADQTGSTLTINNAQAEASGNYSVAISDGTCSTVSSGTLTVTDVIEEPELAFTRNEDDSMTLTWEDSQAVLQSATTLTGSNSDWTTVEGATSGHVVDTSSGDQFFRLVRE